MKISILTFFISFLAYGSETIDYNKVELSQAEYGVSLIDNSELRLDVNVKSLCMNKGDWAINGGYYNEKFKSLGYLKIAGKEINKKLASGLSGILGLKPDGSAGLYWARDLNLGIYSGILQNGPFLIDPGGKMGINSDDGKSADRVAVGIKKNGNIVLIYSRQITLYKLAAMVRNDDASIESLLNMDGGPMAGFWSFDNTAMQVNNRLPAISYVKFFKK